MMCLLVLLLVVGYCGGTVTDLSVLCNGQYVPCSNAVSLPRLSPSSQHVFRCTVDRLGLRWEPFFNGSGLGAQSFSVSDPVNDPVIKGNFTYTLTNKTAQSVVSTATVDYGMSRSIASDTLRCTDSVDGSTKECSLIQKDEPDRCESGLGSVNGIDNDAKTFNITVSWSTSDCSVGFHYKLNPPHAPMSEGNTNTTSTSITSIPANGTLYNVVITPIDFLGIKGPTCQTPIGFAEIFTVPSSCSSTLSFPSPSSYSSASTCPSPSICPSPKSCSSRSRLSSILNWVFLAIIILLAVIIIVLALILIKMGIVISKQNKNSSAEASVDLKPITYR